MKGNELGNVLNSILKEPWSSNCNLLLFFPLAVSVEDLVPEIIEQVAVPAAAAVALAAAAQVVGAAVAVVVAVAMEAAEDLEVSFISQCAWGCWNEGRWWGNLNFWVFPKL